MVDCALGITGTGMMLFFVVVEGGLQVSIGFFLKCSYDII